MREIGVNTWVWTSPLTDEAVGALLGRIADMGFDAVELPLEDPDDLSVAVVGDVLAATDWREVIERDDIDVVDVCVPGHLHAEVAIAALEAGKHVIAEKPLANTLAEAEKMVATARAARERGVHSMVGFNYRCVPARALARTASARRWARPAL